MSSWPERRRSKGAQTKNPAAHLELPDFERSGLCSDARRADCSNPMFLPIPGLNNREYVKTAIEVLRGRTLYGKKVVVAGGGMTGAETAVFLAVQGCNVTIIEMAPDIITDAVAQPRACLLESTSVNITSRYIPIPNSQKSVKALSTLRSMASL